MTAYSPSSRLRLLIVAGVIAAAALVGLKTLAPEPYEVNVLTPTADGLVVGSHVKIGGLKVGKVRDISVQGDQARLALAIDPKHAPLHAGTDVRIRWNSIVGRRYVDLTDGPKGSPTLPEGKLVIASTERVELDDIVKTLDGPTRRKVKVLVAQLDATFSRNDQDLNETLEEAGPFVEALGEVLEGVGRDGDAIRALVTNLHAVTSELAAKDADLGTTVQDLRALMVVAARRADELGEAIDELPPTLRSARTFFGAVPDAVDEAVPLLEDLEPATDRLPSVARNLDPVLTDLRPVVAELRPTLRSANLLLAETPAFLDSGSATFPEVESALQELQPAVTFIRPYTPETIGFITNWASLFSAKGRAGHFGRAMVPASISSFNSLPDGFMPPGMTQGEAPKPGELIGQPWTDANGDGIR